jgi:predicted ABC-type ATPase
LAKDRVRKRVLEGGHFIADDVIERRYKSGIKNLFTIYQMHVDSLLIYDNSNAEASLIAEKEKNNDFIIHVSDKFQSIKAFYHEQ